MRGADPAHGPAGAPGVGRRASGALEGEILGILRSSREPLSPGDVRERIRPGQGGDLSYSTVVTIVSRLHDKGLLSRQRSGRGFIYTAVDEASLAASRMSSALGSGIDHGAVLSRFVSGLSGRDAKLLRRLLAEAADAGSEDTGQLEGQG
jgi:predicted transcriptional regulator